MSPQWERHSSGFDRCQIGRYTVIVWTGSPAVDLDDGFEVCEVYIPTTDREYPDGLMIVGRRRLSTRDREEAKRLALDLAFERIAERDGVRLDSNWAANLAGAILIGAVYAEHKIEAPQYDAHVTAYHSERDRLFQIEFAKRPRRKARPFNRT